jgi:hypothetical protein
MFCTYCGFKNIDSFNFCASCGKSNTSENTNSSNLNEIVEFVLRPKGVVLSLPDDNQDLDLYEVYKQMVGSKYFDEIIFDAIFTTKRVLIRPVSKMPNNLWMLGALIHPGLAQTADLLNKRISSFLSASATSLVGKEMDADILDNLPSWSLSSLIEVKESLPSFMNAASTIMKFSKISNVREKSLQTALYLVFDGSASISKKHLQEYQAIAKLCNFDNARIKRF